MALHLNMVMSFIHGCFPQRLVKNWRNGFLKVINIRVFMPVGPGLVENKMGLEKSRM